MVYSRPVMLWAPRFGLPGHIVAARRQGKTQHHEMLYRNWRQRRFLGKMAGMQVCSSYAHTNLLANGCLINDSYKQSKYQISIFASQNDTLIITSD
jgi:hypothetical protein